MGIYITTEDNVAEDLLFTLTAYSDCCVIIPNEPDLDALAAGWGLCGLLEMVWHREIPLLTGSRPKDPGALWVLDALFAPLQVTRSLYCEGSMALVLVSASLQDASTLLAQQHLLPQAIIDRRLCRCPSHVPFWDVRPSVAATSSIISSYYRDLHLKPEPKVALAMLSALRVKNQMLTPDQTHLDREMLEWLTEITRENDLKPWENSSGS